MKKTRNINFKANYKCRASVKKLILEICRNLLILSGLSFLASFILDQRLNLILWSGMNILAVCVQIIVWFGTFYIVSPEGISKTSGIFFVKTETVDISSVASVKIRQGIIGQLLRYGDIELENPLTKKDLIMENISKPMKHATLIEKARLEEKSKQKGPKVIPL